MERIHASLLEIKGRYPHEASPGEIMNITGILIFFLLSCFDNIGRGDLTAFYEWIAASSDASTLWRTKHTKSFLTNRIMIGIEFFIRVIPMIKPRIYSLGVVHIKPVIAYPDAEWKPPRHPPLPQTQTTLTRKKTGTLPQNTMMSCNGDRNCISHKEKKEKIIR